MTIDSSLGVWVLEVRSSCVLPGRCALARGRCVFFNISRELCAHTASFVGSIHWAFGGVVALAVLILSDEWLVCGACVCVCACGCMRAGGHVRAR